MRLVLARSRSGSWAPLALMLWVGGVSSAAEEKHYPPPSARRSLQGLSREERRIIEAFERVKQAVVVLETEDLQMTQEGRELLLQRGKGAGSGVLVSEEGDVLTAAHVVSGARSVRVRLWDGRELGGRVVFSDAESDVAVVRVEKGDGPLPAAELGDSDLAQVGQTVLVIGAPLGAEHSLSVGHLSARRRGDEIFGGAVVAEMLQTDAAVSRGSSGGPLVNLTGEVIGIISSILTTTGGSEGLGFAIASNSVKQILGQEPVPWIGVNALFIGTDFARVLNIPFEGALLVQSVVKDSPAERAGIRGGDVPALLADTLPSSSAGTSSWR